MVKCKMLLFISFINFMSIIWTEVSVYLPEFERSLYVSLVSNTDSANI